MQSHRLQSIKQPVNTCLTWSSAKKNGKKGQAVLLQAWSGPEGSRKLRFPDYMTTAQGKNSINLISPVSERISRKHTVN
jgi:hypothetical protein